jgi:Flp pilus assembly pilin Flp
MRFGRQNIRRLFSEEGGQDLAEYCLLLALIVLVAAGVFLKVSGGIQSLWTVANTTLASAATSASNSTGGSASATSSGSAESH